MSASNRTYSTGYPAYATGESEYVMPDPVQSLDFSAGEVATVAIVFGVLLLDTLVLIYAIWRSRTFKPLKARQLGITCVTMMSTAVLFFCAGFVLFLSTDSHSFV